MRSIISYYSYSGNTEKVVNIFSDVLRERGEVDIQRLKPKSEITNFIAQCKAAFTGKRAELEGAVNFDASPYDIILIGSPVWAFAPTPAINTFLDDLSGMNGKRAVVLLTSGSGAGVKKCFNNIRNILQNKGAHTIDEINIPDRKLADENFIRSSIEKILG